jgi:hypothetical protein
LFLFQTVIVVMPQKKFQGRSEKFKILNRVALFLGTASASMGHPNIWMKRKRL